MGGLGGGAGEREVGGVGKQAGETACEVIPKTSLFEQIMSAVMILQGSACSQVDSMVVLAR